MFSALVLAPLALAAPVPKALKRADAAAIVGEWEVTAATYGGDDYPSAVGTKWTLKDDGTAVRDRPNQGLATAKFEIDPKADPKAFDWHTGEGFTFLGVYELDGDTFKVCLRADAARPTKLTDTRGSYVFEFKRREKK
jgi:uncharacterized protein (TIGR03067 family)